MGSVNKSVLCYESNKITSSGIWEGDNPLEYSLPLFIVHLTLVVVTTRLVVYISKPFRIPRVIAELIGGVMLGPSVFGRFGSISLKIFPVRGVMVTDTMANLGLLYFMFLVGVEVDLVAIKRTGRKAFVIAIAGMILPFAIGASSSFLLQSSFNNNKSKGSHVLFLGISLSVTAFPVLGRILAELKILNTELGRIAVSSAIVNDMFAWVLLALAITLSQSNTTSWASVAVVLSSAAFVLFCIIVIRPAMMWIIRRTPEGENFNDVYICLILTGVMLCGFVTDALGTHSIFGAFVFGLVIPNGPLGTALLERLEDFVTGLLLPLYFAVSGLNTNLGSINMSNWFFLFVVIILASAAKVSATLLVALYYRLPFREGVALGWLMNTKGMIEIIVLNIGRDQGVLVEESFSIMVCVAIITGILITPMVMAIYKPARRFVPYKRRTIQRWKPDTEFRMLACIHTPRNVPTIINLLEASNPTKKSPICVYALHLVELTGRASAMLIIHNTRKSGRPAHNRTQAESEHIINAFENYEQQFGDVSVHPLTAISPYSTMHEDICNLAEDKRVAFIILPFHKQQTVDGGMETTNNAFRTVNQNVLANAPCSVGILVDRGLSGSSSVVTRATSNATNISHHIMALFFGGPDDREALSYASRMAEHPNITLTILRFVPGEDTVDAVLPENDEDNSNDHRVLTVITGIDKERQIDEDFLTELRVKYSSNNSIVYTEKSVNNGEDTVSVIRSMDGIHDLYIVGRGQGMVSPLTTGLTDWSECPELGAIGDLLASSDFAATVSVLVVQQYVGMELQYDGSKTPDSPAQQSEYFDDIRRPPQEPTNGGAQAQHQHMPMH